VEVGEVAAAVVTVVVVVAEKRSETSGAPGESFTPGALLGTDIQWVIDDRNSREVLQQHCRAPLLELEAENFVL